MSPSGHDPDVRYVVGFRIAYTIAGRSLDSDPLPVLKAPPGPFYYNKDCVLVYVPRLAVCRKHGYTNAQINDVFLSGP